MSAFFEMITKYPEIFLNSLHGFIASIACCFVHQEVRQEISCLFYITIYKLKCLNHFKFAAHIDDDYIHRLRYSGTKASGVARMSVISESSAKMKPQKNRASISTSTTFQQEENRGFCSRFASLFLCILCDSVEKNDFYKSSRSSTRKSRENFLRLISNGGF